MKKQKIYTKEELINKLKEIASTGWIPNARRGNHGGIGNTLEDKLGIKENNLPDYEVLGNTFENKELLDE